MALTVAFSPQWLLMRQTPDSPTPSIALTFDPMALLTMGASYFDHPAETPKFHSPSSARRLFPAILTV
jgi:hypothetical protein